MKINLALQTAFGALLLLQTGCPTATTSTGPVSPPAAQVLAPPAAEQSATAVPAEVPSVGTVPPAEVSTDPTTSAAATEIASAAPQPETLKPDGPPPEKPKPNADGNPNSRPKADRTPRKPGEPIRITFDNIILGMQADIPYRPWMLNDDVKELEGQRISITGVMLDTGTFKKGDSFILLRNKECKYGAGGQADHLADVKLKKGHVFGYTKESVRVEGVLHVEPVTGSDGNTWSIYVIDDAIAK